MTTTDALMAKGEISSVLNLYAHAVDRRDWAAVRSCYHDDAYDDHGPYKGGPDGLVEWISTRHEAIEQSMHFLGNIVIELESDHAYAETYCLTFQRMRADAEPPAAFEDAPPAEGDALPTIELGCRYLDRFERRDGTWRIARRIVAFEWMRTGVRDEKSAIGADWSVATRDDNDPWYLLRHNE